VKRVAMIVLAVVLIAALVAGVSTAFAAKPQAVIERSNGFPSGAHFNLNIHGKKADYQCDPAAGGGSVFVPLYGDATIQYVSNKKSSVTELIALDPCAEAFDGDPIKVQLPSQEQGYYVFARILGKPNNGSNGNASSILLYPNVVIQACNDDPLNPDPDFGNYTSCDDALWALGLIVGSNVFVATEEQYVRFDPGATTGKGKSQATDITRLFTWSGWVCDASLDTNGNGVIDVGDVPEDQDGDLDIDETDLELWLNAMAELGLARFYTPTWIFNIADLVVTEQPITNNGTKLLQIRFYPVATTVFTP
jgi:hypothetical protein